MGVRSYLLIHNMERCTDCGMCSCHLPTFLTEHDGTVIVSESNFNKEPIREAILNAIEDCPNNAISIEMV